MWTRICSGVGEDNLEADDVDPRHFRAPPIRYDEVNRRFLADGDVMIAALMPITRAPGSSGPCDKATFSAYMDMFFFEPFLFVLRTYNFSLTARLADGSRRRLSLGFAVGDQCRNGDITDSVKFALEVTSTLSVPKNRTFPSRMCSGFGSASGREVVTSSKKKAPILALIGPWLDDRKIGAIAPLMAAHELVQIATRSARDEFSCQQVGKNGSCHLEHEFLFRVGTSDRSQAFATVYILKHFGWTHFAVITGANTADKALLEKFLKETRTSKLCPAFVATLDTQEDAVEIDALLRRHAEAKVVVMFAHNGKVRLLMDTIVSRSRQLRQDLPRIWIGNDKWGSAIDLPFDDKTYQSTMQAVLGLWSAIPAHFDEWSFPLKSHEAPRKFVQFITNITAASLRGNPMVTGNPLFCRVLETLRRCSGVCDTLSPGTGSFSRCSNDITVQNKIPGSTLEILDLVDRFTLFTTVLLMDSLEKVFQRTVNDNPTLTDGLLRDAFIANTKGKKLHQVVKGVKFPCNDDQLCEVFPSDYQELLPNYEITAVNIPQKTTPVIGHWTAGDFDVHPDLVTLRIDRSLISFGRNLFSENDTRNSPEFVNGSMAVPASSCKPECVPGWGVAMAPIPQPVCCHMCLRCLENEYSPGGLEAVCKRCPPGYAPKPDHRDCYLLPVRNMDQTVKAVLITVLVVYFFFVTFTMLVFFRYSKTSLVRSSDRPLTACILLSMVVGCVSVFLKIIAASTGMCLTGRCLASLSMVVISNSVLIKTSRFARLQFTASSLRKIGTQWSFSITAQLLHLGLVSLPGFVLEITTITIYPPWLQIQYEDDLTYEVCSFSDHAVIAFDVYLLITIGITVCLAFYTRKLPLNYNEANLLFLASFSQCAVWAVLRPPYYLSEPNTQQLVDVVLVFLNMAALWLWLFVPRLYILLSNPNRRTQSARIQQTESFRSANVSPLSVTYTSSAFNTVSLPRLAK